MAPGILVPQALSLPATVGIEFEMIVPGAHYLGGESGEIDLNYDPDRPAESIDDIINFFGDGDNPIDYSQERRWRGTLRRDYENWLEEQVGEDWDRDGYELLRSWMLKNIWPDVREERIEAILTDQKFSEKEIEEIMSAGEEDPYYESARDEARDAFNEEIEQEWENRGEHYGEVFNDYFEDARSEHGEEEWLDGRTMVDISDEYGVSWPYYSTSGESGKQATDKLYSIAILFGEQVGEVDIKYTYHDLGRDNTIYNIEPDSSIRDKEGQERGFELISPALPISEMIRDFRKIRQWMTNVGAYTNKSTGLHINVSLPGFSTDKIDYVKLVLLLGDVSILQKYGRLNNTYAKPAIDRLRDVIVGNPARGSDAMAYLRGKLLDVAGRVISTGWNDHNLSVNLHSNRIEFRAPGGDWLQIPQTEIEGTLARCVVALDAAMHPEKHREEYAKKLFKFLNPPGRFNPLTSDIVELFSHYAAGTLSHQELTNLLKTRAQIQRNKEAEDQIEREQQL